MSRKSIAMCAASEIPKLDTITYPKLVSTKLDGIRCLMINGVATSRWNLPIPNLHVQKVLGSIKDINGLDGELMLRDKTKDFNDAQSAFMSVHGEPDFVFNVFDYYVKQHSPFKLRLADALYYQHKSGRFDVVKVIKQNTVRCVEEIEELYKSAIANGHEGLIIRDPEAPYKWAGRSTLRQQWMLKLKPVKATEVTIIGFEELMHNADTSSNKIENQIPGGTLGAFVTEFICPQGEKHILNVGTGKGLTALKRQHFWDNQDKLIGQQMTVLYQELSKYGVPRIPRYKAIRVKGF